MIKVINCKNKNFKNKLKFFLDRRRYGKIVTKVEGLEDSAIDINQLAKLLKNKCAAGGTVKGRTIELQGDHKKKAAAVLQSNGFNVEVR